MLSKSTIYSILALRVLVDINREFSQGMLAACIGLKTVFASVNLKELWALLGLHGISEIIY